MSPQCFFSPSPFFFLDRALRRSRSPRVEKSEEGHTEGAETQANKSRAGAADAAVQRNFHPRVRTFAVERGEKTGAEGWGGRGGVGGGIQESGRR